MKKRLILLLVLCITFIIFLSGCNSGFQEEPDPIEDLQDNSPLLQVPGNSSEIIDETGSTKPSSSSLQRINEEGEVSFNVTFANPLGQHKEGYLSFIVILNTHSMDLSRYPLNQNSKLFDNNGDLLAAQSEWETEGDSHHLIGKLHFKTKKDLKNIDGLKLVINNVGGAGKREFIWEKQDLAF